MVERELVERLVRESNHIENVWDETQVAQSMLAWDFLVKEFQAIEEMAVLLTHNIIMATLNPRIAGKYRTVNVIVGSCTTPHYFEVPFLTREWVSEQADCSPKNSHIWFEKIHPFEDGNGRTGRMLMWFQQYLNGEDLTEIAYEDRFDYYDWFRD